MVRINPRDSMTGKDANHNALGIVWDLGDLYQADDDPKLDQDLNTAQRKALRFVTTYKGHLSRKALEPGLLLRSLRVYESIHKMGMKPYLFAHLRFSSNTQDHGGVRLLEKVKEAWEEISGMLTFFRVELMALPDNLLWKLAHDRMLSPYRHFLDRLIQWKPYTLSEGEEKMAGKKDLSGKWAFVSLYDELLGSLSFQVRFQGRQECLHMKQILDLQHSPDRALRGRSFGIFLRGMGRHGIVIKNILNAIMLDHHLETRKRNHPTPMHRAHLHNEVDEGLIENMMTSVEAYYPVARRYFQLKARSLGIKKLRSTDLQAPLTNEGPGIGYQQAKAILLDVMRHLHPHLHARMEDLFNGRLIDAEARSGKRHGAFCLCLSPDQHPRISMGYSGNMRDLLVLAHEAGHALHCMLAARQSYLNFSPPPILAETASTFFETQIIGHLMNKKAFKRHRPALLAALIEGILVTVFRQNVITRFEQTLHLVRQDHTLSLEEIGEIWWKENGRLYGDAVVMVSGYQWGWTAVPHLVHHPFYCYSYIFGNLLSLAICKNQGKRGSPIETLIPLLSAGSSTPPLTLLESVGLAPRVNTFWDQALGYFEGLVEAFEKLTT